MNIDDYISKIGEDLDNQISQLNDSINASLNICIGGNQVPTSNQSTVESQVCENQDSPNDTKQYHLLIVELYHEKGYQISPVPIIEDDVITEENLRDIINTFGDVDVFGSENGELDGCVTSLGDIELIKAEDGEKWYDTFKREADETYGECDVDFEPGEVEILDEGITITGPQPLCRNCFALYLDEDERFDPELLVIRNGNVDGSMIVCEYNGVSLRFEGMGIGDEDRDYYEEIHVYLNGKEID